MGGGGNQGSRRWIPWVAGFGGGVVVAGLVAGAFLLGQTGSSPKQAGAVVGTVGPSTPASSFPTAPIATNPLPGLMPDVPATGCNASAGAPPTPGGEFRLSYVAGLLTVGASPGTSLVATFHMPNGDFVMRGLTNTSGERVGYAFFTFRLDNWTAPEQIPHNFNIVVDVEANQGSSTYHCATEFLPGT